MKFKRTLLCGVAATALGLAAALPADTSILPSLTTPAQAQVQASVSIGFGTFYDSLSPHGDWVRIEGRHVWVPGDVGADWRPYTVGRWAYTRPYGWTWVSDEPYGWAVYHYGRWGYHNSMGWYWVPDTEWAPAWVTWRGSGDYTAWAPMPPQGVVQISYDVDPYAIPARYWVAVPTNRFLAPNLFSVAIHFGEPNFYDVVRYTRPIGHTTVYGDVVVNNTININYIEEVTGENVEIRQVNYSQEPGAVSLGEDALEIYAPTVEEEPDAAPQQVRAPEEIAEERGVDVAAEEADEQADQPIELAEDAPELPEQAVNEDPAPVTEEDVAEEAEGDEAPGEDVAEEAQPDEAAGEEAAEGEQPEDLPEAAEGEQPADEAEAAEGEQPSDAPEAAEGEQPADLPEAAEGEQPADAPEAAEGEQPADAPEAAEGEQPADMPEAAEGEQPEDLPEAAEGEQPADMPEAAEGEQPADMPEAAEGGQPEAPNVTAEPDAGPEVEERAIGEPAEQGQGQAESQGQEQPQQRGRGKGKGDEEEELSE